MNDRNIVLPGIEKHKRWGKDKLEVEVMVKNFDPEMYQQRN
jgi:hypothetical protein